MNLKDNIIFFLQFCTDQKALNPKTIKAYRTDLLQFYMFTREIFDKENIVNYISVLHKQFKPKTVRRKIASIKAFTHFLILQDIIDTNPFDKIDTSFREPILLPKTIPFDIINSVLFCAYNRVKNCKSKYSERCAIRDIAVLEILFATGARVSEICSITPDTIDLSNHTLKIFGKGAKERIIQLENPDVLKALNKYYDTFSDDITSSGYFFVNKLHKRLSEQSVRTIVSQCAANIGYKKHITPHMFRHSFATLLLEEDVDIRYIQKILGHSSITTTQIYTHVAMAKQKEILTVKHPRNKMIKTDDII